MLVIPGAAVRRYVRDAVDALSSVGIRGDLRAAPGERVVPADLRGYGHRVAAEILEQGGVDALVGLSVGAQVAAVAAARVGDAVGQLVLISPTVDPAARTVPRLVGRWAAGGRVEPASLLPRQLPDWWRAGPARIATVVRSALAVEIEELLPDVTCPVTVVHSDGDVITSHAYAARLSAAATGRLVLVPGSTHSWPFDDAARFVALIDRLLR
ncbi:alpha/beta fold hydrolase [Pseudonocardia sp.]|uniref:alpha/beta fold hydrolase n=1 Tax=Pseudonocardia sp. TaxID=60912 RepID=UPI003D0B8DCC